MTRFKKQTIFGKNKGNCFASCVASLLDIPLEGMPNFCAAYSPDDWWGKFREWVHKKKYEAIFFDFREQGWESCWKQMFEEADELLWIASGYSPRGNFLHSVIYKGPKLLFDPHPSDAGLDGDPLDCTLVFPYDPIMRICERKQDDLEANEQKEG